MRKKREKRSYGNHEEIRDLSTWAELVKKRDRYTCVKCGDSLTPGTYLRHKIHAHHVLPRNQGGKNTLANGTTFCNKCHSKEHHKNIVAINLPEELAKKLHMLCHEENVHIKRLVLSLIRIGIATKKRQRHVRKKEASMMQLRLIS